MKTKVLLSLFAATALFFTPLFATDHESPSREYSASMGSVTVDGQQLYRLSFRPEVPLGTKLYAAFDIELFIDEEGNIDDRGWRYDTGAEIFDTVLRKLYYVRYGQPQDPLFAKIGALDDVTLGFGLIMDGYRNTLDYPGLKNTGLHFQLNGTEESRFGIEGIINNFQDIQGGGPLLGVRASVKAAGKLEIGVTYVTDLDQYGGLLDSDDDGFPDQVDAFPNNDALALDNDGDGAADEIDNDDDNDGAVDIDPNSGLPADAITELRAINARFGDDIFPVDEDITRKNPFNKDQADADRFSIVGLDASYPIAQSGLLTVKLYGQVAMFLDDSDELSDADALAQGLTPGNTKAEGFGITAPGLWAKSGPLQGRIEFRHFSDDFDSGYFDNLYDHDRARLDLASGRATPKDALLGRGESQSGVFGALGVDIGKIVFAEADYQYLAGGDDPKQQIHASASASQHLLENIPRLTRARAFYQKNNIGAGLNEDGDDEDGFFESTEDTFYGYTLGIEVRDGVSILFNTRYLFSRDADLKLMRRKVRTIETVFDF